MRALAAAPRSAFAGVNYALALERSGDLAGAERQLLATERMNRLWLPRWTLASFYLRRGRPAEARRWGRLALERSNADVRPALFALLGQAGVEAGEWLLWCKPDPELLGSALHYLSAAGRPSDLAAAAALMSGLDPGRAPAFWRDSLYSSSDRLLSSGQGAAAVRAWNAVSARRMLPFGQITPANLLGNPAFRSPLDGQAFNWRFSAIHGVSRLFDPQAGAVRIAFDGSQPELVELLSTWVWLEGGRRHRFSCLYRTHDLTPAGAGPVWRIGVRETVPMAADPAETGMNWLEAAIDIPPAGEPGREKLILSLQRRRGSVRASGEVEIRSLRLQALE